MGVLDLDWSIFFTVVADFLTLGCYGLFSFLILLDVWRAIRNRATWLPGKAFSLTGVTVQIIVWWTSVGYITNQCKKEIDVHQMVALHQIVVSGKVALCVFIGYLLPGMGAPSMRAFLTLGIGICVQLAYELYIFQQHHDEIHKKHIQWETWMKIANPILFICFTILGLILVCTILGSQTLHYLLRQRAFAIFSTTKEDEFQFSNGRTTSTYWHNFEGEVLKSWLVARACRADYVISRSIMSSAVGVVVTCCVIISVLSNTFRNKYFGNPLSPEDFAILSLLFSFIIIGWIMICWRWLAAQLYFNQRRWRLRVEDFWTRSTVELIHMYDIKKDRQRFLKMHKLIMLPTKIFYILKLHKLLYLVLILQLSVVFFSKLCGFVSEVIIGKCVYWLRKRMRKGQPVETFRENKSILEFICMPGEDPFDLWEANEMSFNKVKGLMQDSYEKGCKSSLEINSLFGLYSLQWGEDGRNLLNMLQTKALPLVRKHFPAVEEQSVRITAVSLITIFIRLHKGKSDGPEKVLKACHEVWDILSFADECDIDLQANDINLFNDLNKDKDQVCMAAEREFYKLKTEYDKLELGCEECAIEVEEARSILKSLWEDCGNFLRCENILEEKDEVVANLSDSKDWLKVAPKYNLYKLCKLMLEIHGDEDFVEWTKNAFRNVIAFSMSRVPHMLVQKCRQWAQEFDEDKVWEATDLAGKCRGLMEAWTNPGMDKQN